MKEAAVDLEANGLNPDTFWCMVAVDLHSDEIKKFGPDEGEEAKAFLLTLDKTVWHNGLGYDLPRVLEPLLSCFLDRDKIEDTMVMSMLYNPILEKPKGAKGAHGLEAYGLRFGYPKVVHEDWSQYSVEMMNRCVVDAQITKKAYHWLTKKLATWSRESLVLEYKTTTILNRMTDYGFYIDPDKTNILYHTICNRYDEIAEKLKNIPDFAKRSSDYTYRTSQSGSISKVGLQGWDTDTIWGGFTKITFEPFNVNSTPQKVRLLSEWWTPYVPTKSGKSFKICEENLATLREDAPTYLHELAEFAMLKSRKDLLDGLYKALGTDGHVHGSVFSCGAVTHRCSHFNPNLANVPGGKSPYGPECRELFTVRDKENYRIVGIDADGVQLRVLAHYMKDPEYMELVGKGGIHDYHVDILSGMGFDKGEWDDKEKQWSNRYRAKNFIYAFLLGGGGPKLASLLNMPLKRGRGLKTNFLKRVPALKSLIGRASKLSAKGFIQGIDGRYIVVKDPYYVLSALLQGGEAVLMKTAMVLFQGFIDKNQWDARFVAFPHDEWQLEAHKDVADEVSRCGAWCIEEAGRNLGFRLPMTAGTPKIGETWNDTH